MMDWTNSRAAWISAQYIADYVPTAPTEPPTQPATEAPTQPPTEAPTQAQTQATVRKDGYFYNTADVSWIDPNKPMVAFAFDDGPVSGGDSTYFTKALTDTGAGTGFWEAPRGALYHSEKVSGGKIEGYQIIIPTTWNLAPINQNGEHGPIEQALIGCPVGDIEKPINALRLVHSYDPCVSCAVHVSEPATGKHFETVTNPWGVK